MKITIYELLGMIKDNKAPKKIRYSSYVFKYTGDKRLSRMYVMEHQETYLFRDMVSTLTNEVEILESATYKQDEQNDISKLPYYDYSDLNMEVITQEEYFKRELQHIEKRLNDYHDKINEIIDKLNGDKDE